MQKQVFLAGKSYTISLLLKHFTAVFDNKLQSNKDFHLFLQICILILYLTKNGKNK